MQSVTCQEWLTSQQTIFSSELYACIIFSDLKSGEGLIGKPTSNPHQIKEGGGELLLHGRSNVMVRLFTFLPLNEGT